MVVYFSWKRHVSAILFFLTVEATKTAVTGKSCKKLSEGGCQIFLGDLAIDDKTTPSQLASLIEIKGHLIIEKTSQEYLYFPKLAKISARKAPAVRVKNNPKLKFIEMPYVDPDFGITVADNKTLIFEFSDVPQLSMTQSFIQFHLMYVCKNSTSGSCHYAVPPRIKKRVDVVGVTDNYLTLVATGLSGAFLTIVAGISMDIIKRQQVTEVRNQEKKLIAKRKQLEKERETMREDMETVDKQRRRQTLKHFHSFWNATNGEMTHAQMLKKIRSPTIKRILIE